MLCHLSSLTLAWFTMLCPSEMLAQATRIPLDCMTFIMLPKYLCIHAYNICIVALPCFSAFFWHKFWFKTLVLRWTRINLKLLRWLMVMKFSWPTHLCYWRVNLQSFANYICLHHKRYMQAMVGPGRSMIFKLPFVYLFF